MATKLTRDTPSARATGQAVETSADDHATAQAHGTMEPIKGRSIASNESPAAQAVVVAPAAHDTPEQQAALLRIAQHDQMVAAFVRGVAETGTVAASCRALDIARDTAEGWMQQDPTLRGQVDLARRSVGERVVSRMATAVLEATNEQLLNHPTGGIAVVNWLLPELRPNAGGLPGGTIAVQVNLSIDQRRAISEVLVGPRPSRAELGLEEPV